MRALVVDVCAAFADTVPAQLEKSFHPTEQFQIRFVFAPAGSVITREHAEKCPDQAGEREQRKERDADKQIEDEQNEICDQKRMVELIDTISAVHKLNELLLEFFHDITTISIIHFARQPQRMNTVILP